MRKFCVVVMLLATVCTGLLAGLVLTYSVAVMPGLANADDRTLVDAFQQIDRALDERVWFWVTIFIGAIVLIIIAIVLTFRVRVKSVRPWLIVAAVLYATTIAMTGIGIDSLETDFGKSADNQTIGLSEVRADLQEDRWIFFNNVRLATTLGAFVCLAWSLVLFGRATSQFGEQ